MECQASESKKLFKVFDASKRKRSRKKRDGYEDSNSVATDESVGVSICYDNYAELITKTEISSKYTKQMKLTLTMRWQRLIRWL